MREFLKRKIQYKIDGRLYTLTNDDLSVLPVREVITDYISLKYPSSNMFFLKPYTLREKERNQANLTMFNTLKIDSYKYEKTSLPLIPRSVIDATNNLSLFLASNTDNNGDWQGMGLHGGIRINRLRGNKEYNKKVDIIEGYYPIVDKLSTIDMIEIKESFSLSSIGVSFALVLKKDFSEEVYELYFHKLRKWNDDNDFVVIDLRNRKFYRLKDKKGILLKVFRKILARTMCLMKNSG